MDQNETGAVKSVELSLEGCRVLVPRASSQRPDLAQKLSALGADAIDYPCMSIRPIRPNQELDKAIAGISGYGAIVFLSPEGVDAFMERVDDIRAFHSVKFVVWNLQTAAKLAQYKLIADEVANEASPEALAETAKNIASGGGKIMLCRAANTLENMSEAFSKAELDFEDMPVCYTECKNENCRNVAKAIADGDIKFCALAGSAMANAFASTLPKSVIGSLTAICSGEHTAIAAIKRGMQTAIADKATFSSVAETLERAYNKQKDAQ